MAADLPQGRQQIVAVRAAAAADRPALRALVEGAYRGDEARAGWTHEADLLGGRRTDVAALGAVFVVLAKALG